MRIILVGRPLDREKLRPALADSGLSVVGEVDSLDRAAQLTVSYDALLVAPHSVANSDVPTEALTAREREVLELVAEGLSNKAIASRLHISDQTVKFHVASIAGKLGASNRTEAVRIGMKRGLITL